MNASFINGYDITTFTVDENNNVLSTLMSSSIEGYEIFNKINNWRRLSTMDEKRLAKEKRLNEFYGGNISNGAYVEGDSRNLSPRLNLSEFSGDSSIYSYTKGDNYYADFAGNVNEMPATQEQKYDGDHTVRNHTDLYSTHTNLYPDDKDALGDDASVRWKNLGNRNSLMAKTKELFRQGKINTIISRFHTDRMGDEQDVGSKYGLSHGRNLLKRSAEFGNTSDSPNGNHYDNPYCRVWTHHYQYDRLDKLIRPFVTGRDTDNPTGVSLIDLHTWTDDFRVEGGWKNENMRWNYSVLNNNGFVNITPKFKEGGGSSLHTKQCMFSIENLAWKGMSPYEFERNVSWEQRGPMGGRIMWFPPYGITFQETTSTQWNASTFIGRGEDVYTYVNTKRSGQLNFMMVVDHPSVTDYSTWYRKPKESDNNVTDTDVLRFFAGCDAGNSNDNGGGGSSFSLFSATRPPKYTEHEGGKPKYIEVERELPKVKDPEPIPKEDDVEPEADPIKIVFYVFYPNNYSGVYDLPNKNALPDSRVNFAAYLINGVGTNKKYMDGNDRFPWKYSEHKALTTAVKNEIVNKTVDIPLDESTFGNLVEGQGYEIYKSNASGIGFTTDGKVNNEYVPIMGTTAVWSASNYGKDKPYPMMNGDRKNGAGEYCAYYYRPDGSYTVPKSSNDPDVRMNTYDDQLKVGNYQDKASFGFNSSLGYDKVAEHFTANTDTDQDECLYAFTEVAAALNYDKYGESFKKAGIVDESRLAKLVDIVKNYKVLSISGFGSASSHSNSATTSKNQKNLNTNRYMSVVNWLQDKKNTPFGSNDIKINPCEDDIITKTEGKQDVSTSLAKLGRYAKVVVEVRSDSKKKLSETNQTVREVVNMEDAANTDTVISVTTEAADGTKTTELKKVVDKQETTQKSVDYVTIEEQESQIQQFIKEGYTREEAISILNGDLYNTKSNLGNGEFNGGDLDAAVVTASRTPKMEKVKIMIDDGSGDKDKENYLRYDQEYRFFKELKSSDPIVFSNLMDKLQYFDPAFHSMTPEGFNGRLAFLHQCTRQGNTVSSSDQSGQATNLAFGRPPICVLRLGDFYNQMIVINSISMTYDTDGGVQWDLNPEGNGVQPLIANISISFDFIGGGDMYGPIRRLQNAMTFNYYANQGLYDNRADYVIREWDHMKADAHSDNYDGIKFSNVYPGPIMDDRKKPNESGDGSKNNSKHD